MRARARTHTRAHELLHLSAVDEGDLSSRLDENVAGMRVPVNEPRAEDHACVSLCECSVSERARAWVKARELEGERQSETC